MDAKPSDLNLIDVSVAYRGHTIFSHLNHCFARQSWHIILGKSGAGKTTLLRAIAGLLPFSGKIVNASATPIAARTSLMAQHDDLLPWLTALENVTLGARLRGEKPDFARANDLLAAVNLAHLTQRRPRELSGGQRQRIALARTLYERRDYILMDEPFSALDAVTRYQLQNLAIDLLKNQTVIMITHDPAEALRCADYLYILDGSPAILRAQPLPTGATPRDGVDPAPLLKALAEGEKWH